MLIYYQQALPPETKCSLFLRAAVQNNNAKISYEYLGGKYLKFKSYLINDFHIFGEN